MGGPERPTPIRSELDELLALVTVDERAALAMRFGLDRGSYRMLPETPAVGGRSADEVGGLEERAVSQFLELRRKTASSPAVQPPTHRIDT